MTKKQITSSVYGFRGDSACIMLANCPNRNPSISSLFPMLPLIVVSCGAPLLRRYIHRLRDTFHKGDAS